MAHFARLDDTGTVTQVVVVPDEQEHRGKDYLANDLGLGGVWVQTSYSSRFGKRVDPDTGDIIFHRKHYRYNYAGIGFTFDPNFGEDGAFIPPKPEEFPSFVIDPNTATWVPPLPVPIAPGPWAWDEGTLSWVEVSLDDIEE